MHPHAALIHEFYEAFARRDADAMARCYSADVVFNDAVFTNLVGERASGMWRMLVTRGKDLTLTHSGVEANDRAGKARWIAHYTFTKTGRRVENIIDASFTFRDGLIVTHTDQFDFHRWARQAFGPVGLVLGWTPFFQAKVRAEAMRSLDAYLAGR